VCLPVLFASFFYVLWCFDWWVNIWYHSMHMDLSNRMACFHFELPSCCLHTHCAMWSMMSGWKTKASNFVNLPTNMSFLLFWLLLTLISGLWSGSPSQISQLLIMCHFSVCHSICHFSKNATFLTYWASAVWLWSWNGWIVHWSKKGTVSYYEN